MPLKIASILLVCFGPFLLLLMDLMIAINLEPGTWIEGVRNAARGSTLFSWPIAVLIGHWFHPKDNFEPVFGRPASIIVLLVVSGLLMTGGALLYFLGDIVIPPVIIVVLGMVAGALLWPV